MADHLCDLVDFEIERTCAIGNDVKFVNRIVDVNPIDSRFVEQIYCRRTEEREVRGVHDAFKRRVAAAEQDHQFEFSGRRSPDGRREIPQFEKAKALWKREVFLKEAIALER